MKKFRGFTLAEVLITLAIIGVVAAISIPSVISNSQQREFKTGLKKAVSVLNSAITMNMAIDGESPYDNGNLFGYLQRHMNVMSSTYSLPWWCAYCRDNSSNCAGAFVCKDNAAFYTTDGMRFEFHGGAATNSKYLRTYEHNVPLRQVQYTTVEGLSTCGGCGSYGLNNNPDETTKAPCLIMVDVNGDRKPTPGNVNAQNIEEGGKYNLYIPASPDSKVLRDIFPIMITDREAIPYGVVAQKAMYEAQK